FPGGLLLGQGGDYLSRRAEPRIGHSGEKPRDLAHSVARDQRRRRPRRLPIARREKVARRATEERGRLEEHRGRDAVRPLLVFLNRLEGQAERPAELALVLVQRDPAVPYLGADVKVDRVRPWAVAAHFAPPFAAALRARFSISAKY